MKKPSKRAVAPAPAATYNPAALKVVTDESFAAKELAKLSAEERAAALADKASVISRKIEARAVSATFHKPEMQAAFLMLGFGENLMPGMDVNQLVSDLEASNARIASGDMKEPESMLLSQAHSLGAIFMNLANRSRCAELLSQYETYMRLALKAQSQCRATLETLAAIKNPPVVYARQANFANGPQQVNNGQATAPAYAAANVSKPNELSRVTHEEEQRLDAGTLPAAITAGPRVETVGQIDRSTNRSRKGKGRA